MSDSKEPEFINIWEKDEEETNGKRANKTMLSASDVAGFLNISEHTVYRWCKSGKIPYYNLESTYRFDKDEFEQWLAAKHQRPE
ncbi:MAG: helix-turn-helix domain-containing protein [Candidatus Sumerlaeia bacterium]